MNLKILRRDEIWLISKIQDGVSTFGRMDDMYDVRFDKMLQHSYLNGEYSATPMFGSEEDIEKLFNKIKGN